MAKLIRTDLNAHIDGIEDGWPVLMVSQGETKAIWAECSVYELLLEYYEDSLNEPATAQGRAKAVIDSILEISKEDAKRPPKPSTAARRWRDVKNDLELFINLSAKTPFAIFGEAGLTRDAYYKSFSRDKKDSPMRKSSIIGLAEALSLTVQYRDGIPYFKHKPRTWKKEGDK